MANTLAPFGFQRVASRSGASPTFGLTRRKIASGNSTKIYNGDPVVSLATGYITRATAGTTQIAGIFAGCRYNSVSRGGQPWFSPYWPGADATGDVEALIVDDAGAVFRVQANSTVGFADINAGVNFALGTGSDSTGQSGASIDISTINTTVTLPFRILDIVTDPPGANGTDTTTPYGYALVRFNYVDAKSTLGIV